MAAIPEPDRNAGNAHTASVRFAGRLGRHAAVYAGAAAAGVLSGLVTVAVVTRFLTPTEFGELAVLTTIASMITLLVNLGSLQGTMRRMYGSSGDEDADDDHHDDVVAVDPRIVLSTGLLVTTAAGLGAVAVAALAEEPLSQLLVGHSDGGVIVLSAVVGATGSVMRLARNTLRLQRRSQAYLAMTVVQTFGAIGVALPLLVQDLGITAVLVGLTASNVLAVALGLVLLRHDVAPTASYHEARRIMRRGVPYIPLVLSFQVIQLGDVLLVSQFANLRDAGLYRVAQRIATPVTYGTSVFQQAWGPLRRDLVYVAADEQSGRAANSARLATYYAAFVCALILPISIFADVLVRVSGSAYSSSANLIPLVAIAVAGHGAFVIAYRLCEFPDKRTWFIRTAVMIAALFIVAGAPLVGLLGAAGVALAMLLSWTTGAAVLIYKGQRGDAPIPFQIRQLLTIGALTVGAWLASSFFTSPDVVGNLLRAIIIVVWAGSLVATNVIPLGEVLALGRFMQAASGEESSRQMRTNLERVNADDRQIVDLLLRHHVPLPQVAEAAQLSEPDLLRRMVAVLRSITGDMGDPLPADEDLGRLLISQEAHATKDSQLRTLAMAGMDPLTVDRLTRAACIVARRPRGLRLQRRARRPNDPVAGTSNALPRRRRMAVAAAGVVGLFAIAAAAAAAVNLIGGDVPDERAANVLTTPAPTTTQTRPPPATAPPAAPVQHKRPRHHHKRPSDSHTHTTQTVAPTAPVPSPESAAVVEPEPKRDRSKRQRQAKRSPASTTAPIATVPLPSTTSTPPPITQTAPSSTPTAPASPPPTVTVTAPTATAPPPTTTSEPLPTTTSEPPATTTQAPDPAPTP